ncbi:MULTISPECIES: hypothetical protein [Staphylococcus]|uniref:hypothetical protein n=1 Tax=Staphylococcus TaxID=1279 RepID=UPI000D58A827|nr:hypothetical protein [Staphylococcus nepalensis]AWI44125.1 hypothetical protein BJG88_04745 [Staphylococcus nepalensis]MDR5650018.1 hypothetical protein [Staphylococcus nepalensis]SUM67708.1 Uncharacterised protein [Staphylococcus nepalensis]SUM95265.1 Uncharacterised protein [Staphylococcus nepalensis]
MTYSEKVEESVEFADLINKVQSVLDFVCSENDELKIERDCAIRNNDPYYYQAINNNMKANYIVTSTLLAIRNDIETMHDDIRADINQEKNALSTADQSEDNA